MTSRQYRLLGFLGTEQATDTEVLSHDLCWSYYSTVMCLLACRRRGWIVRGEAIESYRLTQAGRGAREARRRRISTYIQASLTCRDG